MAQLEVLEIKRNRNVTEGMRLLVDPLTIYANPDFLIKFMDVESKKIVKIYVPKSFKSYKENWFQIGEIWESRLSNIYESLTCEDIFVYDMDCGEKHYNLYYDEKFEELHRAVEETFIVKTEKGYLKGDLFHGIEFVEKEHARTFKENEILAYWSSISDDLTEFGIKTLEKELVEI